MDKDIIREYPIKVGISIGDVNGIGPEVIIKALRDNRILAECTAIIYGSTRTMNFHKKSLNEDEFNYQKCKSADEAVPRKINIVSVWNEDVEYRLGESNKDGGKFAFLSLEAATADLAAGKIDVLVTAPISKDGIQQAGFQFAGHTEYLANKANQDEALMMMVGPKMRVALVSSHIPLKDVSSSLTKDKIIGKARALNHSLQRDFGIQKPKIAILGLNPHAGENGKLGKEETEVIIPAIQALQIGSTIVSGPFPADGFFGSSQWTQFDGILAMYHDQGLTAFKALSFDEGVNFTAGLPIVRTSPDHGTGFDIAGKNIASGQSMRSAIYLAMDVWRYRQFHKEINSNPLSVSKGKK
jgi:4-hydroxythreonine-4-phosphate dehydrogenase